MQTDRAVFHLMYLTLALCFAPLVCTATTKAEAARVAPATFPVTVNGRTLHYVTNFEPVMPGQDVVFAAAPHLAQRLAVQVDGHNLSSKDGRLVVCPVSSVTKKHRQSTWIKARKRWNSGAIASFFNAEPGDLAPRTVT